jgi:hypothetical protein
MTATQASRLAFQGRGASQPDPGPTVGKARGAQCPTGGEAAWPGPATPTKNHGAFAPRFFLPQCLFPDTHCAEPNITPLPRGLHHPAQKAQHILPPDTSGSIGYKGQPNIWVLLAPVALFLLNGVEKDEGPGLISRGWRWSGGWVGR